MVLAGCGVGTALGAPADTMEQRVAPCLACHGETGADLESGYAPRLHGKPAGYLFNQLVNFREGRRYNHAMNLMVAHLSDAYLWEMSEFFAEAEAPYADPVTTPAGSETLRRGRQLATEGDAALNIPSCQSCHGERLTGVEPNTPGLVGLPRFYIMAQLGAWRAGTRRAAEPDCMHDIANSLSGSDTQAVATWLASQPVPEDPSPAQEPAVEPPMECGSVNLPGYEQ